METARACRHSFSQTAGCANPFGRVARRPHPACGRSAASPVSDGTPDDLASCQPEDGRDSSPAEICLLPRASDIGNERVEIGTMTAPLLALEVPAKRGRSLNPPRSDRPGVPTHSRTRPVSPLRASRMAAAVAALGTVTSKRSAFSTATRVSSTRTASDRDRPMAFKVLEAFALMRLSTRT